MALRQAVQWLAGQQLLRDLPLEMDAVGSVSCQASILGKPGSPGQIIPLLTSSPPTGRSGCKASCGPVAGRRTLPRHPERRTCTIPLITRRPSGRSTPRVSPGTAEPAARIVLASARIPGAHPNSPSGAWIRKPQECPLSVQELRSRAGFPARLRGSGSGFPRGSPPGRRS